MITIAQGRKALGARVIYQRRVWRPDETATALANKLTGSMVHSGKKDAGVITSVNDQYIFVRFDDQPEDAPGRACYPGTLDFEAESPADLGKTS